MPAGTVIADKYRVEQMLGRGGMGVVVEATHLELGTRVAIKLLLPELNFFLARKGCSHSALFLIGN